MEVTAIAISIPFITVFVITGLLINLIQAILYLTVQPICKNAYRRINGVVSEMLWIQIVWLVDWWAGLKVKLYTDLKTYQLMGQEHALLMPNHLSDVDTFIAWLLAQRSGCLRAAPVVVKKSTKYLPIFGLATWFYGFIFLDRTWAKDEKKLKKMEVTAIAISVPFGIVFVTTGLLINLIQAILYLTVRPIWKNAYIRINGVVSEMLWIQIIWLMDWWAGFKVKLYTDLKTYQLMGQEHALLMSNHLHDVDTFIAWLLAQRSGCLRAAPVVVKKSTKYLPIFGWATWFYGFIFLDRTWAKDEKKLKAAFEGLKDFPRPFWLTIFVEGTRMTPDKLLDAQNFAISKGLLPIPNNVLIPRTKGFVIAVQHLRSFVPAIYDVTMAVEKGHPTPSTLNFMKGKPSLVHVHIKRYPMNEIPESDEGIAEWCRNKFVEKDASLEKFKSTSTFDDKEIEGFGHPRKLTMFVFLCCCAAVSLGIIKLCARFSLLSTWRGCGILSSVIVVTIISSHIFIEFTKLPPQKSSLKTI